MSRNARRVELPLELAPSGGPLRHRVAPPLARQALVCGYAQLPETQAGAAAAAIASALGLA